MEVIVPGVVTWEAISRRLQLDRRDLARLLSQSIFGQLQPAAFGRGLGTYRLFPLLAVPLLRQMRARTPRRLDAWQDAIRGLLASATWQSTLDALRKAPRHSDDNIDRLLLSSDLLEPMAQLQAEMALVLDLHGLTEEFQLAPLIVDRIDEEEDAVVLVGQNQVAYLLPRSLLTLAGIAQEQARGTLTATRTGAAVEIDAWPRAGAAHAPTWQPDPALWAMRTDVTTPDWDHHPQSSTQRGDRAIPLADLRE